MKRKGRYKYVPASTLEELDLIKFEDNLFKDSQAFKKMVNYTKLGREVAKKRGKDIWKL